MHIKNPVLRFFAGIIAAIIAVIAMIAGLFFILISAATPLLYLVPGPFSGHNYARDLPAYPVTLISGSILWIIIVLAIGFELGDALFGNKHENE